MERVAVAFLGFFVCSWPVLVGTAQPFAHSTWLYLFGSWALLVLLVACCRGRSPAAELPRDTGGG